MCLNVKCGMMMNNYLIGVDAGGSKTHAVFFDKDSQSFAGPANISKGVDIAYNSITTAVDELIIGYDIKDIQIGIGIAGYSVATNREALEQKLLKKYPNLKLVSDCHLACLAAHSGQDGAIMICGTGVVAYSIKNGVEHQLGGFGYPHGDLGGGAWLGLEVCKHVCKAIDDIIPWSDLLKAVYAKFDNKKDEFKYWLLSATPGDFANIARSSFIVDFLKTDINAREIFTQGINEILGYIKVLKKNNLSIKLVGGVAPFYLEAIQKEYPDITLSDVPPVFGVKYLF